LVYAREDCCAGVKMRWDDESGRPKKSKLILEKRHVCIYIYMYIYR